MDGHHYQYVPAVPFEPITDCSTVFIFVAGCAGRQLDVIYSVAFEPATAVSVLSFGAVILGYGMTWAPLASDFVSDYVVDKELLKQPIVSVSPGRDAFLEGLHLQLSRAQPPSDPAAMPRRMRASRRNGHP